MRTVIIRAGVLLLAALAYFLFVPHAKELPAPAQQSAAPAPAVYIHDAYSKGVHTLRGAVQVKNPCTTISAQTSLSGASTSPSIAVAISSTPDDGVCLQLFATSTFTLTVPAPRSASITATFNGAEAAVVNN